jgi:hypothetical protein
MLLLSIKKIYIIVIDPLLNRLQLNNHSNFDNINFLNKNLILNLILPTSLHYSLLDITTKLFSFQTLEFYTDSLLSRDEDMPLMGYRWIFTTDLTLNIKHSGSTKEWASSTKAELVAIGLLLLL